ncbi:ribonuclease E inhibitor RraA/Dimethylmenaquinone methyltransferase [Mycena albidolilacea]|uniref:Ribonuclease E inhibitor RraA/Dimethylmenaquinone methyltransferase n=1 Tax=Mycena albidolilacea TaxID=1033008 RepID=A0AAD7EQ58_9AGAR|nr:ribonuclease E inhibitor RraA/Dimethylmenaquinone methyltransferase [Mycena albidolilacea]
MSVVSKLASFSTCEISDALIKLGVTSGGYIAGLNLFSAGKICAPAYTVKMVLTSDKSAPKLSEHFVDTAPAGSVIVIDAPREAQNAVWGGLMSAGAIARSAVGVVISGHCRDLAEHRALGFPVFARSHSTLGQQPFTRPSAINIPLVIAPPGIAGDYTFPSVTVEPGDWIIGDEDGVVCVSKAMEGEVAEEAESKRAVDAQCMIDIQAGKGIQATFAKYRK